MGEPLTDAERAVFQQLTEREREPLQPVEEFIGVIGRRGGKSRAISVVASYAAALCEHTALVPGERGIVLSIAPDVDQATIVLDYVEANLRNSPLLAQLIEARTRWTLKLTNRIDVQVRAADFRRLRGPSYVCIVADESAFWLTDEASANPDSEILNAVRPGLATTGGPLFIISSPHARKGELWRLHQQHFGPGGDPRILVAQAPSRVMNPSLPQSVVDRAMQRDLASATAEFGAEFRVDIESFVSLEVVRSCITAGVFERAPERGINYAGFVDPSGGSGNSMTLAVAHSDSAKHIILDAIREVRPPFSPEQAVQQFAEVLNSYRIGKVQSDRYGGPWVTETFGRFGIKCEQAAKAKTDLYVDLLPLLNSGRIALLDHARLTSQLIGLERRTSRSGRDIIGCGPNQHDDICNAVAGVAATLLARGSYNLAALADMGADDIDPDGARAFRMQRFMQHIARYG
jgi:hypothetical protein